MTACAPTPGFRNCSDAFIWSDLRTHLAASGLALGVHAARTIRAGE
jgi:hypothetical protein